ncbi:unnamed protein product, partial [Polarella glacialis]
MTVASDDDEGLERDPFEYTPSRGRAQDVIESRFFNIVIGAVIVANAIVIGLETDNEGFWLYPMLEDIFLGTFVVELSARICVRGLCSFWSTSNPDFNWNLFDFVLVGIGVADRGLVSLRAAQVSGSHHASSSLFLVLRTFRLLRILRIFRIFRVLKQMYLQAISFASAVGSVLGVGSLVLLIVYICGIVITRLYGNAEPDDPLALVKQEYFGTVGASMLTLFQLMAFPDMERFQP